MLTRRTLLRSAALAGGLTAAAPLLGACGQERAPGPDSGDLAPVRADVARAAGDEQAGRSVARAVADLGARLFTELTGAGDDGGNLVLSPYSVAVALAMTRAGARGRTAAEMDTVLGSTPPALHEGLSWLDHALAGRTGPRPDARGEDGTVGLATASALWAQHDIAWAEPFLATLARHHGAGVHRADFRADAEAARARINAWTAEQTRDRITDLLAPGALDALTRLVLVNAIWLKAPWFEAFEEELTRDLPFHRADGSTVAAPTMGALLTGAGYAEADGWRAVSLPYVGKELAMAVVVPDQDRSLEDLEARLAGGGLARMLDSFGEGGGVDVRLPRWTFRTNALLKPVLTRLGMPTAFDERAADFSAMTTDVRLLVDEVVHEGFIAVDEKGTEAAAATAVVVREVSAPLARHAVHADRPFLFVVYDAPTGLPLFLGRVADPTA